MARKNPPLNSTAAQAASGKGMPAKAPREQRPGQAGTPQDGAVQASLELPHERDQSLDMTPAKPDPAVKQAARDLRRGLKDTSKAPEMDRAYKKLRP